MRALMKSLIGSFALLLLASCGGGGGSDSNSGFNPTGVAATLEVASTTTTPNSLVGITVRVTNPNGPVVPNGTAVQMQVSPPGVGLVSATTATTAAVGESVSGATSGGIATFRLHSRALGTATLTASVVDPFTPTRTVTATASVAVNAGPPSDPRVTIQATATSLPINPGVGPFIGSPYIADVTLTQRSLDGALVSTGVDQFGVAINPVTIAAFSTLDDPTSTTINEFVFLLGNGPVDAAGGRATVFVHSDDQAGTAVLTVTAQDPQTGEVVSAQQTFTVVSGASGLPGSVVINATNAPVYIQGVNGTTSKAFEVAVFDGAGGFPTAPAAGVNNVRLEIVGGAQGSERLQGPAGQQGGAINVRTSNSVANATYQAGTRSGPVTLRATADRADNNVDNGIQDGVTSTRQFSVSDGRLFDLEITNASISGPTSPNVAGSAATGVYSMRISVIGQDRFGNPVPPGQEIRFGVIDAPQVGTAFAIAGGDGDPQEGGTLLTAPGGAFTTAGSGAGAGDTLVLFGEETTTNRDHESARTVTTVNGPTSLTVQNRFNFNDDTGTSVNTGPSVPYVVGRALDGNIEALGTTDSDGFTSVVLFYPASKLGKNAIVWAQGQGDFVQGTAETVADVERISFQGAGDPILTAIPASIFANRTVSVRVCLTDAIGTPIPNQAITFAFSQLNGGTGSVDGIAGAGTLANRTGIDGCVNTTVITANVLAGDALLTYTAGAATAEVDIIQPGTPSLTATPSLIPASQNGANSILLRVTDGGGLGIGGAQIAGSCVVTTNPAGTSTLAVNPPFVTTDSSGSATTTVTYSNFIVQAGMTFQFAAGTCTFTTTIGSTTLTDTVQVQGQRFCGSDGFSPPPPGCP